MALSDRPNGPVSAAASVAAVVPLNQQAAQAGPLPVTQVISAVTETLIMSAELPALPLSIALPPNTQNEQTVLDLFASGILKTTVGGPNNQTIKVYAGNSPTIANNVLLGSSGAVAQNSATAAWFAHARLIYDSVSDTLAGDIEFYVNKTVVAKVTLSNFPATIKNTNSPVATFSLTLTSSAAAPATPTTIVVQKFSVG